MAYQKPPFVERNETTGKLKGFFVDLLDLLAAAGNFSYILSEHHVEDNVAILDITQSHPTGLINELKRQVGFNNPNDWFYKKHYFLT